MLRHNDYYNQLYADLTSRTNVLYNMSQQINIEDVVLMQQPVKVYMCRGCNYTTPHRWVLVRHLVNVHEYPNKKARVMAMKSEYLLNTYHGQEHPWSIRNKSKKKEVSMKKVRTLQDILDRLEAEDIDPRTVVVNPQAISVVSDSDDDDDSENKKDE